MPNLPADKSYYWRIYTSQPVTSIKIVKQSVLSIAIVTQSVTLFLHR